MIREELFVQRGKELDVAATDPDVRSALVNAVELEIAENAITSQPSEAALRQFFETHQDRYVSEGVMRVRDWCFPRPRCRNCRLEPRGAQADDHRCRELARLNGRDSGKTKGEEFYFAAKIHLGDELFAAARDLTRRLGFEARSNCPMAYTFSRWKGTNTRYPSGLPRRAPRF